MNDAVAKTLAAYESRLTDLERTLIRLSPLLQPPSHAQRLAPWPVAQEQARYDLHMSVPRLRGLLLKGPDLRLHPEAFGLALGLGAFELRNSTIHGWPGFVLLMHKILGDAIVPWLPSLFLAAVALPDVVAPEFDLDEVLRFARRG